MAVRAWAPCGQTPLLRVPLTHDHLAAISGITRDGRLFMQTQDHAYRSPDIVRFVRLLLRKDLFELLEKAIDRCRDAGNVIYAIVLKNS